MSEQNGKEKELFIRYGSAASEAMFDFPCQFFRLDECEGIIPYRIDYNCAVIIGDPISPINERLKLTEAFHKFCKEAGLNIIYITVSQEFADQIQEHTKIAIPVCEEIIFDPQQDVSNSSHRMKHRIEKAVKRGLTFHEYIPVDKELEKELLDVGNRWESAIKGPHLFLGHLNFFESYIGKRWFYVKDGKKIVSMAMLSKLELQEGWLLKFLVSVPTKGFHETSEFMMISLLDTLKKENCQFLTKGMIPVDHLNNIQGLNSASGSMLRGIYAMISCIFKFKKRKEYWQRYHPKSVPAYLVLTNPKRSLNEIRALTKAFRMH